MKPYIIIPILLLALLFFGKHLFPATDGGNMENSYRSVSPQTAMELMQTEQNYIILDVRTVSEYGAGHIPGAICLPNELIGTQPPAELPDKAQLILVYCRSGNRSKQAAQKLFDMGYTNIVEFGGINSWPGEIVS